MTSLGVIARREARPGDAQTAAEMSGQRGAHPQGQWRDAHVALCPASSIREQLVVSADASFYYLADLRRALGRGSHPAENTGAWSPGTVVAAAYDRWGPDLAAHLEGDFAFVLWDAAAQRLVAARDFGGSRALFWAGGPDELWLASSARSIRAGREDRHPIDAAVVAAAAAGLSFANAEATAFQGIRTLPAGHTLVWEPGRAPSVRAHWTPPEWRTPSTPLADAARELRTLLSDAVEERLDASSPTAITLSGGWDSTALFATARDLIESGRAQADTVQISVRYPPDDPGREDDFIRMTLAHWGVDTHWLDSERLRLFDGLSERAGRRDQPMAHLFETWNRGLAEASRTAGARIMFTGYGGDQLFQVSDVYMADLLRSGRWRQLRREWRAKRGSGLRSFFRFAVLPNLPDPAVRALGWLRGGRPPRRYLERPLPPWIQPGFASREGLSDRDRAYLAPRGGSRAEAEWRWYLTNPFFPAVHSWVRSFGAQQGVEVRSPLYDGRIIDFQAGRPWSDRSLGVETKRLLRLAMKDLLPDALLAPRASRTGVTSAYASRQIKVDLPPLVRGLQQEELRLSALGIIDGRRFCDMAIRAFAGQSPQYELVAFMTLSAELWLRGLERPANGAVERLPAPVEVMHG